MSTFAILSLVISFAALFGWISYRWLRLPTTIGTMILALSIAAALRIAGSHAVALHQAAFAFEARINFNAVVLHGILALLLFAGSLHLDLEQLRREKLPVLLLSVVSTALSTLLVGAGLHLILALLHISASWLVCLLFGALISPTDPVAVLELLDRVPTPRALKSQLAGESLFNDGVGAVLFLALLAASTGGALPSFPHFLRTLAFQAGGGIALGLALGYITYRLIRPIDNHRVEVLLTLALAMGGYALADSLGLSMPLEAVAAGLVVNGQAREFAMSEKSRAHLDQFWEIADDILTAVLFFLLGLQILVIPLPRYRLIAGALMIPVVLASRLISVSAVLAPMNWISWISRRSPGTIRMLTWGGLRGGLSVALALSLPRGDHRNLILTLTYSVVIASILGQGLTMNRLMKHLRLTAHATPEPSHQIPALRYGTADQVREI